MVNTPRHRTFPWLRRRHGSHRTKFVKLDRQRTIHVCEGECGQDPALCEFIQAIEHFLKCRGTTRTTTITADDVGLIFDQALGSGVAKYIVLEYYKKFIYHCSAAPQHISAKLQAFDNYRTAICYARTVKPRHCGLLYKIAEHLQDIYPQILPELCSGINPQCVIQVCNATGNLYIPDRPILPATMIKYFTTGASRNILAQFERYACRTFIDLDMSISANKYAVVQMFIKMFERPILSTVEIKRRMSEWGISIDSPPSTTKKLSDIDALCAGISRL